MKPAQIHGIPPVLIAFFLCFTAAHAGEPESSKPKAQKRARTENAAAPILIQTPPPTHPPLAAVEIASLPEGCDQLDLYVLAGQSNMKGRGFMPEEPSRNPQIVMMHMNNDHWYVARHPLHMKGDPITFEGADNAGVGPGLAFAEALCARDPKVRVGLVPCAVGGSSITAWAKGAKLYDETLRRARLALAQTSAVHGRLRGILWLQGEADAAAKGLENHEMRVLNLVDSLRMDLGALDLPFILCTIGEMVVDRPTRKGDMNRILLSIPAQRSHVACVDARDLKTHIGDFVHFDTEAQNEIGRRFAAELLEMQGKNQEEE